MQAKSEFWTPSEEKSLAASPQQVACAINSLTANELWRLGKFSTWRVHVLRSFTPGGDQEDLLHEAIAQTLTGRRIWRPDRVSFFEHLRGAMRSISSAWRAKAVTENRTLAMDDLAVEEEGEKLVVLQGLPAHEPNPERQASARQLLGALIKSFGEDTIAVNVLLTMDDGHTDAEVAALLGIAPNQYFAARKRIKRRLERILEAKQAATNLGAATP